MSQNILKGRIVFSRISCWYIHVLWCVTVIEFNELYFTVLLSHKLTLYNVRILSTKNIFDVIFEPLRLYSLRNTVTKQYWALLCVYHYVYLWSPCYMSLQSQSSVNYCTLRELDGRGHFLTVFISCWRRALYKNVGNYATLKAEILEIFFTKQKFMAIEIISKILMYIWLLNCWPSSPYKWVSHTSLDFIRGIVSWDGQQKSARGSKGQNQP